MSVNKFISMRLDTSIYNIICLCYTYIKIYLYKLKIRLCQFEKWVHKISDYYLWYFNNINSLFCSKSYIKVVINQVCKPNFYKLLK